MDQIRNWVKEINTNIDQFKKVELLDVEVYSDTNSDKYSIEGTEIYRLATADLTRYHEDGEFRKIAVTFDGDREDLVSTYYFRNGNLFFVDKFKTIYHKPKWHDQFDKADKSILKNQYYLKDNKLIRWVNTDIKSVSKMDPLFTKQESTILNDANLYLGIN